MKELYSSGTFIGHVEWPAALDQSGKFQLTAIPKEVQDDLAALSRFNVARTLLNGTTRASSRKCLAKIAVAHKLSTWLTCDEKCKLL